MAKRQICSRDVIIDQLGVRVDALNDRIKILEKRLKRSQARARQAIKFVRDNASLIADHHDSNDVWDFIEDLNANRI